MFCIRCLLNASGLANQDFISILAATKLAVMESESNRTKDPISKRESEIIECLSHGLSEKEIGEKLFISPKTVKNHMDSIRRKLGVSKNIEIIAYYVATLKGKEFSLKKLREYGIASFLIFVHVCRIDL